MYCSSLKKRVAFAPIVPLLRLSSSLGLREHELKTHDIAIPLNFNVDPRGRHGQPLRQLRVSLLCPADVADAALPGTIERIQHLSPTTTSHDIAVVFLLAPPLDTTFRSARQLADLQANIGDHDNADGVIAYAKLQAGLMNCHDLPCIPILPIAKLDDLPELLKKHVEAVTACRSEHNATSAPDVLALLRQCSTNPPLPQGSTYYLSDLFPSLRALATVCTKEASALGSSSPSIRTPTGAFTASHPSPMAIDWSQDFDYDALSSTLKRMQDLIGDEECRKIMAFWKDKWAAE